MFVSTRAACGQEFRFFNKNRARPRQTLFNGRLKEIVYSGNKNVPSRFIKVMKRGSCVTELRIKRLLGNGIVISYPRMRYEDGRAPFRVEAEICRNLTAYRVRKTIRDISSFNSDNRSYSFCG